MGTTPTGFNSSATSSGSSGLSSKASKTSMTPSSSTSAVPSSTPSSGPPCTLPLFKEPGCHGDHYNFTALGNETANYCISNPSGLSRDRDNVSCTYGNGDTAPSGRCTGGPWPLTPKSWALKDSICTSFRDTECKVPLKGGISFDTDEGCSNAPVYLSFINSLSCSPNTPSCKTCLKCHDDCWNSGEQDMDK